MARSLTAVVARANNFDAPTRVSATTVLCDWRGQRITPLLARLDSRPIGLLPAAVLDALLASDQDRERPRFNVQTAADGTVWAIALSDWLFESSLAVRSAELAALIEAWRDAGLFDLKRRACLRSEPD